MYQKVKTDWGMRARHAMLDKGLTVTELTIALHKSRAYVSAVLSGRIFSPSMIDAISEYLEIDNQYDIRTETEQEALLRDIGRQLMQQP